MCEYNHERAHRLRGARPACRRRHDVTAGWRRVQGQALLPAAGLGTVPLGGLYTEVSLDDAVATVQAAVDAGYRYFDTAPLYGYGAAERALGITLGAGTSEIAVSTKVGRTIDEDASPAPNDIYAVAAGAASWDFSGRRSAPVAGVEPGSAGPQLCGRRLHPRPRRARSPGPRRGLPRAGAASLGGDDRRDRCGNERGGASRPDSWPRPTSTRS